MTPGCGAEKRDCLEVGPNRKAMLAAIGRMTPGDMPQFDPAMRMAVAGLTRTPASVKHCIIISDGDPSDPSPDHDQRPSSTTTSRSAPSRVATHGMTESRRLEKHRDSDRRKVLLRVKQDVRCRESSSVKHAASSRPLGLRTRGGRRPGSDFPARDAGRSSTVSCRRSAASS